MDAAAVVCSPARASLLATYFQANRTLVHAYVKVAITGFEAAMPTYDDKTHTFTLIHTDALSVFFVRAHAICCSQLAALPVWVVCSGDCTSYRK